MTSDRWQRIESLCHAALARPTDERVAFLAEACGDDTPLGRKQSHHALVQCRRSGNARRRRAPRASRTAPDHEVIDRIGAVDGRVRARDAPRPDVAIRLCRTTGPATSLASS
jgi:hypothetical protein